MFQYPGIQYKTGEIVFILYPLSPFPLLARDTLQLMKIYQVGMEYINRVTIQMGYLNSLLDTNSLNIPFQA